GLGAEPLRIVVETPRPCRIMVRSPRMGETRVDLLHLLEDLRDAYPGPTEETILAEIVANALDSSARTITLTTDAAARTLTIVDDGRGMRRRGLARYHGAPPAPRPVERPSASRESESRARWRSRHTGRHGAAGGRPPGGHLVGLGLAPPGVLEVDAAARNGRRARHRRLSEPGQRPLAVARSGLSRNGPAPPLRAVAHPLA